MNTTPQADAIIVLGGGNNPDGTLTIDSQRRVDHAVTLFEYGLAPRIIFSGAWSMYLSQPPKVTEAAAMAAAARGAHIPQAAIFLEEDSKDTLGNAYFVKQQFLTPHHWTRLILVTAEFHALRSDYIFHKVLGENFDFSLAISASGLAGKELEEKVVRERKSLTVLKSWLEGIADGDDQAIGELLSTKHPAYAEKPETSSKELRQQIAQAKPDQSPDPYAQITVE